MVDLPHRARAAADAAEGFAQLAASPGPVSIGEAVEAARQLARASEALGDVADELATALERRHQEARDDAEGDEQRAFVSAVGDAVLSLRAAREGLRRVRRHASSVDAVSCFDPDEQQRPADAVTVEVRRGRWLRARRDGSLYEVAGGAWHDDPDWCQCREPDLASIIRRTLDLDTALAHDRALAQSLAALVIEALGDDLAHA